MVRGNWLSVRQREQRGQIERRRYEFAHAGRSPRLIDEANAFLALDLARDVHLLLFAEFEDSQQLAVKRYVRNFRTGRGDKGRCGQFRAKVLYFGASPATRVTPKLVPVIEHEHDAGLLGHGAQVSFGKAD